MLDLKKKYYYFVMSPGNGTIMECIVGGETYPIRAGKIDVHAINKVLEIIYTNKVGYNSANSFQMFFGERQGDGLFILEIFEVFPKERRIAIFDKKEWMGKTNGRSFKFTIPDDQWANFLISKDTNKKSAKEGNSGLIDVTASFNDKTILIHSYAAGLYASARGDLRGTPLCCSTTNRDEWEQFYVVLHNDGWASFIAYNKKYLTVAGDEDKEYPPIKANADDCLGWEKFKIFKRGGRYSIKANYNMKWLMSYIEWDNKPVYAYSDKIDTWEEFDIEII